MSKDSNLISIELSKESKRLMQLLKSHVGTLSVKNSMNLIGRQYRQEVKGIFKKKQARKTGLRWQKLKKKTLKEKERLGYGNKGILERKGTLLNSMTQKNHAENISDVNHFSGSFGSNVKYGVFHDDATSTRSVLPLRNFSIPSETTYRVFLRIIDEDIKSQLEFIGVDVK